MDVITERDYVCIACYNYQLTIVHHNETISRDDECTELADSIEGEIFVLEVGEHSKSVMQGVRQVLTHRCDVFEQKMAILYPDVFRLFVSTTLNSIHQTCTPTQT